MRILVLTDKVMSRQLGDGLRVYGLLKPLHDRHRFDLICFSRPGDELEPTLRSLFHSVTFVPAPPPSRSSLPRRVYKAFSGADFKLTTGAMRDALVEAMHRNRPDLVLEVAASAVPNLPEGHLGVPLVIDAIDEPLLREMRALSNGPLRQRLVHLYQAWRFWRYERRELDRAVLSIYVSEVDAQAYARFFPDRKVGVVPNGVDTEYFAPVPGEPRAAHIVFEGNMNFGANVDAAVQLVQHIFPRVLARIPDATVALVGRDPSEKVKLLASERVEVTGTVDDVRPYLGRAAVFACPMRLGSGIKNKILQAWAMGRPVVATPESLGGLSARDGVNILVRDDPGTFAEAVCRLLTDRRARGAHRSSRPGNGAAGLFVGDPGCSVRAAAAIRC